MTSCWEVLEIEPGSDKASIRQAYSKKLKKTRPDDDPAGFQRLYAAYQSALDALKPSQEKRAIALVDTESSVAAVSEIVEEFREPELAPAFVAPQYAAEIDQMIAQLEELLSIPLRRTNPDNWMFLIGNRNLLEDDYRVALGTRVLSTIIDFEKDQRNRKKYPEEVAGALITRLDDVFLWSAYPGLFIGAHHYADLLGILTRVDPQMRKAKAIPMGGKVVTDYGAAREKDPALQRKRSFGSIDWGFTPSFILLFLIFAMTLGRSCSTI